MLRLVCLTCLIACSGGFVVDDEDVGPDASLGSDASDVGGAGDSGPPPDAMASDAGSTDVMDAGSTDAGSTDAGGAFFDSECSSPWLFFADPAGSVIRRVSLEDGTECTALDGGGALGEVTSVTIAGDVFVVNSRAGLQGLDLRTNSVVWSIPQTTPPEMLDERTVVVALNEGFIAAWARGGTLVQPTRVLDPAAGTQEALLIDTFFFDLSGAADGVSFWAARSPGERSRYGLDGERAERRASVVGLLRIHALGGRVASVEGRSSTFYIDDLSTPAEAPPTAIDPEDCSWIPLALPSPLNDDEYIIGCTPVGGALGEVGSFRIANGAGVTRPLLVVNSEIWDAEIYAP